MTSPKPPPHLSADAGRWWRQVVGGYQLEPHHLRLLQAACESWDRMQEARAALAENGSLTITTPNGLRPHPAVAVERDSKIGFSRILRELALDAGAPAERSRPPALISNRRR